MNTVSKILGCAFGYLCLGLSVLVSADIILRKFFGTSLQGADELGGYVLAIGSSLAFCVALIGRNHMRIDLLHYKLPAPIQGLLNWLSISLIAAFALLLSWTTLGIVQETLEYHSTAPTPWATPMIYPQGIWYVCLTIFAVVATVYAVRASRLFLAGRIAELNEAFQPKAAREELQEELEDAAKRR